MKRLRTWLREFDEILHEAFHVFRSTTAVVAVLIVEVVGILKL